MKTFKKRILLISNLYPSSKTPFYGTFVRNFETQLKLDARIELVRGVFLKGVTSNYFIKIFKYIRYYIYIIYYSLFHNYDLVYVHLISHSTLPLRFINYFKPLPLVFNIHGEDLLVTTTLAKWLLNHSLPLIKKSKFIVVPSHYFKNITMGKIPDYPSEKIIISASGGIKDIFKPAENPVIHREEITVGYVSRIDRGKGWDTLLDAVRILKAEDIKIHIKIAGGGAQKSKMNDMIKELGISDYIEYVGPIAHEDLPFFYQSLDIFVFPTKLRESLGLVGLEAMACGIPIIGSNIGGLTDYITPNYNGFFFTPANSKELADRIKEFLSLNDNERDRLRDGALLTSSQYSEKIVSQNLFNAIL